MSIIRISSGRAFESNNDESLLDAALRADVTLPYSCRSGRCSTCKGRLISGVTTAMQTELGLSQIERDAGWILTCVRAARSDADIEIADLGDVHLFPTKTLPCRVQSLELLAPDVMKVTLRFPPSSDFEFSPGQSVDVLGRDGHRRSYSIANAPNSRKTIDLHIRQVAGGVMSRYWFGEAKVSDLLRIRGPNGTFFLRDISERDLVFLATGTGIAPVIAILEGLSSQPAALPRSVSVYWGGRTRADIYCDVSSPGMNLSFIPVLSRGDDSWEGARGHVQNVLLQTPPDWSRATVYACGSELMVKDAREELQKAGLLPQQFYSDAFVCSSTIDDT